MGKVIKRCTKRRPGLGILLLALICLPLAAQNNRGYSVDPAQLRPFIRGVEVAVNSAIGASFPGPFGTVQKAKGAYLPGYGTTFTFLINIPRAMINTPMGVFPSENAISPEQKRQRIDALKDMLVRILLSPTNRTARLQKEESIAIVGFFEEFDPVKPEESLNKTLVISVLKGDLDELSGKQDRFNELKQRVKIVEY